MVRRSHLAVLALLAVLTVAPSALPQGEGAPDLPQPALPEGAWWTYAGLDGEAGEDERSLRVEVDTGRRILGIPTWTLVHTARSRETVPNGTFDVTGTTELLVEQRGGALQVLERTSIVHRTGTFQGVAVESWERNHTVHDGGLPLLPAPASVGDTWRDEADTTSTVNRTTVYRTGSNATPVREGPRRTTYRVGQTLEVTAKGNATTPAGAVPTVTVNRTRSDAPGWTIERWSPEVGYLARWTVHGPDGEVTGEAVLLDHGIEEPLTDPLLPPWLVSGAFVGLAVLGILLLLWSRIRRLRDGDGDRP